MPTPSTPPPLRDRSSVATWRLAARLARRETRRRPGRTVLAAVLIALPVVAMTLGSVLVRTESASSGWAASWDRRYPGTDVAVESTGDGSAIGAADRPADDVVLPAGTRTIDVFTLYTESTAVDPSIDRVYTMWTDAPLADPMVAGSVELLSGRWPRDGELLLDPNVADAFGVEAGDRLELARPSGTWTVAGIGRSRDSYWTPIVVAPGFDRDRIRPDFASIATLYELPDGTTPDQAIELAARLGGATRHQAPDYISDDTATLAWGWVGGVLALVAVGIIVAAAFATSARRQLVAVGQLASNGATPEVVRRTLVLQGTWTALVGAVGGVVVAFAALPLLRGPIQEWILDRDLGSFHVVPFDLVAIVVTALVAGTVAAAVPARSLSKVPVMAALSGRRPLGQPPRWLVPTGIALTAGGLGLLAVAGVGARNAAVAESNTDLFALVVILGAVAVVFGMICATPLVIDRAGRLAGRLPLSPRLALRSMARARTRSAAVVAAIAVAVGASVTAGMVADAAIIESFETNTGLLPDDAAVLYRYDDYVGAVDQDTEVDPALPTDATLSDAERGRLERVLPGAALEPLQLAVFDPPPYRMTDAEILWMSGEGPWVATPALLDLIGLSDGDRQVLAEQGRIALAYEGVEVAEDEGFVSPTYPLGGEMVTIDAEYATAEAEYRFGAGNLLLTEESARELGFEVATRGFIVRNGEALVRSQKSDLERAFSGGGVGDGFVEPGDPDPSEVDVASSFWSLSFDGQYADTDRGDLWLARAIIVGVAVLISALVVAIGLALAAAEGRDERDTLTIVGATPATMRRQTATRAATMALTGIALGVPTGFVPTWVLWRTVNGDAGPGFPWVTAGILVVAVPLVVAASSWLATSVAQRLRPVTISHRD